MGFELSARGTLRDSDSGFVEFGFKAFVGPRVQGISDFGMDVVGWCLGNVIRLPSVDFFLRFLGFAVQLLGWQ